MHSNTQRKYQRLANMLSWVVGVYYLVAAGVALLPLQGHSVLLWERMFSALEMVIAGLTNWLLLRALALVAATKERSTKRDMERRKFANWLHKAAIGFPVLLLLANFPSWRHLYFTIVSFGMPTPITWMFVILSIGGSMALMGLYFYFLLELMHYLLS